MKVSEDDANVVIHWKAVEKAKGSRPSRHMQQHYANVRFLFLKPFLMYTGGACEVKTKRGAAGFCF
jgi:hypothetical protein